MKQPVAIKELAEVMPHNVLHEESAPPWKERTELLEARESLGSSSDILCKDSVLSTSLAGPIIREIFNRYRPDLKPFEQVYKDLHQNPELSCQEKRTAEISAEHLQSLEFMIHQNIGGYGVIGVFKNGSSANIMLRAEMDGLPILEKSNLPYASTVHMMDNGGKEKLVSHACGDDMHVTCLMAVSTLLQLSRKEWKGTLVCIFQPNEERGGGAQAMVDDGLYSKCYAPIPDILLEQHIVNIRAGYAATRGA